MEVHFPEPGVVLKAIEVLCRPDKELAEDSGKTHEQPSSEAEQFNIGLNKNLTKLDQYIQETSCITKILEEPDVALDTIYLSKDGYTDDIQWRFVVSCLRMLRALKVILKGAVEKYTKEEKEEFAAFDQKQTTRALMDSSAPPMSPDTFSFEQQKALVSCLQMVISLGVLPNLHPGVGIPLCLRSGFASVVCTPTPASRTVLEDFRLVFCTKYLLELLEQPALAGLLLSHHLGDLLAAVCQIVFAPRTKQLQEFIKAHQEIKSEKIEQQICPKENGAACSETVVKVEPEDKSQCSMDSMNLVERLSLEMFTEDEKYCNKQLAELVARIYQPVLVRELVQLQGSGGATTPGMVPGKGPRTPAWLRRACGRLLSDIIVKPDGVQNILRGMLHTSEDVTPNVRQEVDWKKCDAIAGIIAQCPRSLTPEEYYSRIGPQVLTLLRSDTAPLAARQQFLHVAVFTVTAMVAKQPVIARQHVLDPLLEPLLSCLSDKDIQRSNKALIISDEKRLSQCIEDIHRVLHVGSGCRWRPLVTESMRRVLQPVFCLLGLARSTAVNLRSQTEDILVTSLRNADSQAAVRMLRHLAFDDVTEDQRDGLRRLHADVMFAPGPSGGAVVISKPGRGEFTLPAAEDWEVRCACVMELIKKLNEDSVTADLFLSLLQSLTEVISDRVEADRSPASGGTTAETPQKDVLLEIERRQAGEEKDFRRSLVVLHLLALLAEDVGPSFLTNPAHILDFAKITLERALQVLKATGDEMMGIFESETVTMAMGMLTALMGGAAELSRQDKDNMKVVLPMLQELAEHHPDPEVKEMATDLRIAVATRGAVWSDLLRDAQKRDREKADRKEKEAPEPELTTLNLPTDPPAKQGGGKTERRPLIEVISSVDTPEVGPKPEPEVELKPDNKARPGMKSAAGADSATPDAGGASGSRAQSEFRRAVDELCSPLVPVRGHGLISLRRLVEGQDAETLEKQDLLLKVFRENLDHADSYLYLAAVGGLAALADRKPDSILPVLAAEYANRDVADFDGSATRKRSPEVRMKLGEVIMKTSRALGPMVPKFRDVLLGALLTGARDPDALVRASAVSNLGELCKLLRFSLGGVINEVLSCVTSLIKYDPDVEVRKAAALHTTLLLQGLGKDAIKVLETTLRDVYRLLKLVHVSERDEMVRVHVQLALNELDTVMRELLFPPQTLTKRIRVLDPE